MSRNSKRHLHSGCGESLCSELLQSRKTTLLRKQDDVVSGIEIRKRARPSMAAPVRGRMVRVVGDA